jgi:Tfp pilus assembly protein FimT
MNATPSRGFTVIEGLVCLSIASLLTAVAVPASSALMQRHRAQGQSSQFVAHFHQARMQSIGNGAPLHLRFFEHSTGTGYTLHQGNRDACTLTPQGLPDCTDGAQLIAAEWLPADRGVRLQANVARMTLNPGTMTVTPTGSVTVRNSTGTGHQHTVAITGRIRSEVLQ